MPDDNDHDNHDGGTNNSGTDDQYIPPYDRRYHIHRGRTYHDDFHPGYDIDHSDPCTNQQCTREHVHVITDRQYASLIGCAKYIAEQSRKYYSFIPAALNDALDAIDHSGSGATNDPAST